MAEEVKQDGQKTLVAFIVGLLIGGMLVWAFSGPTAGTTDNVSDNRDRDTDEEMVDDDMDEEAVNDEEMTDDEAGESTPAVSTPTLEVGDGSVVVNDQPAGMAVEMESVTYPVSEGWIGVRDFNNDQLGYIKGVVRFSEEQGLVPENITLQFPTVAGNRYAVVIFTEDGNRTFNLAGDVQIDEIFDTFVAQ